MPNKHIKLTLLPLLILLFCFFLAPILAYADEPNSPSTCKTAKGYWLKLPIFPAITVVENSVPKEIQGRCIDNPVEYVVLAYEFGLGLLAVIAVLMIIWGGLRYLISRGNSSETSTAKDIITQAILGLILGLCSWLILYVINPQLVNLRWDTSALQGTLQTAADNLQKSLTEGEYQNCKDGAGKSPMLVTVNKWYTAKGSDIIKECALVDGGDVLPSNDPCSIAYMAGNESLRCGDYAKFSKSGAIVSMVSFSDILTKCGSYNETSTKDLFHSFCIGLPCKSTSKLLPGTIKDDPPNPNITGDTGGIRCVQN